MLIILLGGWVLLEALTWQAGLGEYAKSPQNLELKQGLTAIVAGGQAGLVFVEDRFRKKAQFLIRCEEGRRAINLRRGQVSDEICGVRVELLDILANGRVNVVVRWGDDLVAFEAAARTAKAPSASTAKPEGPKAEDPESTEQESTQEPSPEAPATPPSPEAHSSATPVEGENKK